VGSLATPLALAEFVGALAIVVLLVVALIWRRRILSKVLVVAIVFGIVFANPFGVVAEPSAANARSLTPSHEVDGARHWVKIGGIPIAWFTPYDQPYPWAGAFENSPNSVLKLRYGFSFLPSTGAASVVKQCSNYIGDPCWRDRADDYPLVHRDADGDPFVVPLTTTIVPSRQNESAYVDVPNVYEVRLGLTSWRSVAYWVLVSIALVLAARMSAVRWRSVGLAVAGCVVAGVALGGILAAVPQSARGAASGTHELLPEPAQVPTPSRSIEPTPIEGYAADCIVRRDRVLFNRCGRIDRLTAAEVNDGALAVWTAEADGFMHLRARRLSSRGQPLGAASTTIRSWDQSANPGGWNCDIPAELQAARVASGNVLIAWSSACDLHGGGGGPASITGLVLTAAGEIVRGPFPMLAYDRGLSAEPSPRYWLRSTSSGKPFLFWEAPTRSAYYGRALFVSRLDSQLRAAEATEVLHEEHGIGSIAVECGAACVVAQGREAAITLRVLGSNGRVLRRGVIARDSTTPRSELVAAAHGNRYYAGWLESDGTNVDGYLVTLGAARTPAVQRVASRLPAGDGTRGALPDPLGISHDRLNAALVFQTPTLADDEFLLHIASREDVSTSSTDVRLGEPSVVGDVLVAIAGLWPTTPAEPVSVIVW
jgi:hypothetical protein